MPTLGIMRRRGLSSGSVTWKRIIASLFVGLGENQDKIARRIIAKVSTSHRNWIKLNKNATTT